MDNLIVIDPNNELWYLSPIFADSMQAFLISFFSVAHLAITYSLVAR
jgi:hypothetical protein